MSVLGKRTLVSPIGIQNSLKNYTNLLAASRKKYKLELKESSAGSVVSGDDHIIFFQAFKDEPMILEGAIEISPSKWARAFLEFDLERISTILCQAVCTFEEVAKRETAKTLNGSKGLPNIKKVAVMRAAKWMLTKDKDPWSYDPQEWPTEEERSIVNGVFETFTLSGDDFDIDNEPFGQTIHTYNEPFIMDWNNEEDDSKPLENPGDSPTMDPQNYEDINRAIQRMIDRFDYSTNFTRIIQLSNLGLLPSVGNTARTAMELTKATIPENTDIFVDAVQFSRGRWAKAYLAAWDVTSCAEILFRKYFKLDCNPKKFMSFDNFCPIKRLAIYRAVAWLRNRHANVIVTSTIYDFNADDPSHNIFLSDEEISKISSYITYKYTKNSSSESELSDKMKTLLLELEDKFKPQDIGNKNLKVIQAIGYGAFGTVYRALDTNSGVEYGVKKAILQVTSDFKSLLPLSHPNLLNYYHIWQDTGDISYIQMELCHTNLAEWLHHSKETSYSSDTILDMAIQTTSGLEALHSHNIIHRHLNPSNVLLRVDNEQKYLWKIGDFCLSRNIVSDKPPKNDVYICTSPEMAEGRATSAKTDVFSLGWIFVWIFYFYVDILIDIELHNDLLTLRNQELIQEQLSKRKLAHTELASCVPWIAKMLSYDPKNRPECTELLHHLKSIRTRASLGSGSPLLMPHKANDRTTTPTKDKVNTSRIREAAEALLGINKLKEVQSPIKKG